MKIFQKHSFIAILSLFFLAVGLSAQGLRPVPALVERFRQDGIEFTHFQPFTEAGVLDETAARFAREGQFLTLDQKKLANFFTERPQAISLSLQYNGEIVVVDLVQVEVLTPDFFLETSASEGKPVRFKQGMHYRGVIHGDNNSVAAFSFFSDEIMGFVSDSRVGNRVLGKLDIAGNTKNYIFYEDQKLSERPNIKCGVEDKFEGESPTEENSEASNPEVNGCVRIFFEVDFALFQNKGTVQATINYVTGCFNQMATLYTNEQVQTQLRQVFVWVKQDNYNTSSSGTALSEFKNFRVSFDADLAHLVVIGGNSTGGVAYLPGICTSTSKYAYSDINTSFQNVPTYSWTIMVLAHETGHNLNSNHTHWCGWTGGAIDNCATPEGSCAAGPPPTNGGTIMSYCHLTSSGINFNNGFGPQPGNKIRTKVSTSTCLAANCTQPNSCLPVTGITVSNNSGTNATIAWTAVSGATSYQLRWRAVGNGTWTTINNASNPTNLTGLPANDEVEVSIQTTCSSLLSGYRNGVIWKTGSSSGGGGGCSAPTGLAASNITQSSATLNWNAVTGATSYKVQWKLSTSSGWGSAVTVTTTTYTINGLQTNKTYNARVQAVCGSTNSAYATTTFTTQSSGGQTCPTPTGLTANPFTSSDATIAWNGVNGAVSYDLQYRLSSSSTFITISSITTTSHDLANLTPGAAYVVKVRAFCSTTNSFSAFTNLVNFTMPSTLPGGGNPAGDIHFAENVDENFSEFDFSQLRAGEISVVPNPTRGYAQVNVKFDREQNTSVQLFDSFGKLIEQQRATLREGSVGFDLSRLPSGFYFVKIVSEGKTTATKRLVKE